MKRFTTTVAIMLAALTAVSAATATTSRAKILFDKQKKEVRLKKQNKGQQARSIAKTAAKTNDIYKPLEETYYFYDEEWIPAITVLYTYDEAGRVATEVSYEYDFEDEQVRVSYRYDEQGNILQTLQENSVDGGSTWTKAQKYENEYDEIVTDFRTATLLYGWDDEWVLRYGTKYDVTRNSGGVVTYAERLTNYQGEFTPIARLTNAVGTDGKITSVKEEELELAGYNEFVWADYFDLRDIQWDRTNGQALYFEIEDYILGTNRIKNATLYFEDEQEADVSCEYDGDRWAYCIANYYNGDQSSLEYTVTDEYGSYIDERKAIFEEDGEQIELTQRYELTMNERGLPTSETMVETDEFLDEYMEKRIYDYTIDPEYDAVCETVISVYDSYMDETEIEGKIVVESFTGLSSLKSIGIAPEISCRLNGRSLEIGGTGTTAVSVYTPDGRLTAAGNGNGSFSLNLSALSTGFYVVRASGADGTRTFKIALK